MLTKLYTMRKLILTSFLIIVIFITSFVSYTYSAAPQLTPDERVLKHFVGYDSFLNKTCKKSIANTGLYDFTKSFNTSSDSYNTTRSKMIAYIKNAEFHSNITKFMYEIRFLKGHLVTEQEDMDLNYAAYRFCIYDNIPKEYKLDIFSTYTKQEIMNLVFKNRISKIFEYSVLSLTDSLFNIKDKVNFSYANEQYNGFYFMNLFYDNVKASIVDKKRIMPVYILSLEAYMEYIVYSYMTDLNYLKNIDRINTSIGTNENRSKSILKSIARVRDKSDRFTKKQSIKLTLEKYKKFLIMYRSHVLYKESIKASDDLSKTSKTLLGNSKCSLNSHYNKACSQ